MKTGKILSTIAACAVIFSLAGCSIKTGTSRFDSIIKSMDISDNTVIATPKGEGIENADKLAISYSDFKKEYLYQLKYYASSYEIESDTEEAYKDAFDDIRSSIINYMVEEAIILEKAKEYGADQFTQEELDQLEADYQSHLQEQYESFGKNADYGDLEEGETVTTEEMLIRGEEEFDKYLADCGMTTDDLLTWQRNSLIATKLKEAVTKDITIDLSEAEDVLADYIETIKEMYATDPTTYETGGSYSSFWLPEGSRDIKHILIGMDEADSDEVMALRSSGDDAGANALRAEYLAPLEEKANEVLAKLDEGADFDALIKEYSADAAASEYYPDGYVVIPDSVTFVEDFVTAAFELESIGDYKLAASDYGWHIMLYADDAEISQEELDIYVEYVHETLIESAKEETYTDTIVQWLDEYDFEIDYNALNISAPVETAEAAADAS